MLKKLSIPLILLLLGYFIISDENIKIIFSGVAIFIIGMNFMEDGFKLFSGGTLERVLEKFTSSLPKAIFTGFLTTSIVQSSSLISVIIISFLSVNLISLTQGIGVIFGANLGTTTTAWLVTLFGLKLKISTYAMPMIIFGVVFKFFNLRGYKGLGNILLGLGFIFLGIAYMKDGFETLKSALDLASYAMEGYTGVLVYILIGSIATVVIQSSSATMAIIITALATSQISYENALALAIGANVGTTVTAILGSLTSNENGKRLAMAHFIFNIITGFVTFAFIYQLSSIVDSIASFFTIEETNYTVKLAIFHTIFNVLGILVVSPFVGLIVKYTKQLIKTKVHPQSHPKYISHILIDVPNSALKALEEEINNLYHKGQKGILHAISLHRTDVFTSKNMKETVSKSALILDTNIDEIYSNNIKNLYSEIIKFSSLSQKYMSQKQSSRVYKLKVVSKDIVDSLKEVRRLQKNINLFIYSKNDSIKTEYNVLREEIANTLNELRNIKLKEITDIDKSTKIETLKQRLYKIDLISNGRIDSLIRENKIDAKMATSLINDSSTAHNICKKLISIANCLWIENEELQEIGEDNEY